MITSSSAAIGLVPKGKYDSDYYKGLMTSTLKQKRLRKFKFIRKYDYYSVKKLITDKRMSHLLVFDYNDLAKTSKQRFYLLQYALLLGVNIVEVKTGLMTYTEIGQPYLDVNLFFAMDYLKHAVELRKVAINLTLSKRILFSYKN